MAEVWEVLWEALPPGFRFHPTNEEVVNHYLMNYIHRVSGGICVIPTVDDLFKRDPMELPEKFRSLSIIKSKDPEWWFLSTLEYKAANSDKFDRRASTGSWKITGNPTKIHDRVGNRLIAMKRTLVFCEDQKNEKTNWVIHQYHLHDNSLGLPLREQKKYVLCHLENKQPDYIEMSDMEVDSEYEVQQHGLTEEIIQAKMRSLTEELLMPSRDGFLTETIFSPSTDDAVYLDDLLKPMNVSSEEESEVSLVYEQETSREVVQRESKWGSPPETLQGYVVLDETSQTGEDARPGHTATLHKQSAPYPKRTAAQIVYSEGSNHRNTPVTGGRQSASPGRYRDIKGTKDYEPEATSRQAAAKEPLPLMLEVRRNPSNRPRKSRSQQRNERLCTTSFGKEGCRAPLDYLVNIGVSIVLLVLILLWPLMP